LALAKAWKENQRILYPKELDDQAPTRAVEHDTFHNDAHSIRTKINAKQMQHWAASAVEGFCD
jgi:hypothetical protein